MKDGGTPAGSHLLPFLLLLPAAVLAWPGPGALLALDPYPHLAGIGYVALLVVPVALWLVVRARERPVRGLLLLGVLWAFVALSATIGAPADTFEARRCLAVYTTATVAFAGGAYLSKLGRRTFNRGVVVLSVVWTLGAFGTRFLAEDAHLAGVLGDTGSLSQAALPGAAIGAWYIATRRGLFQLLGGLAVLLFLLHAGWTPVLAGGIGLAVALLANALVSPWAHRRTRVRKRLGTIAAVTVFALIGLRGVGADRDQAAPESAATAELGGSEVRLRIWRRVPAILASHPVLGLGPGQFQARFPPFRDPREIELSRHGVCSELNTEVEHAHNDALEGLAELGPFAGVLWILFLVLSGLASLRGLRGNDFYLSAMGAAGVAVLTNGLLHSPLLFNPPVTAIGFVLFGALWNSGDGDAGLRLDRIRCIGITVAAVLVAVTFALPAIGHGRALRSYVAAARTIDRLQRADEASRSEVAEEMVGALESARSAARRAHARVGDSAPALAILGRLGGEGGASWERVLAIRPNDIEAWENLGLEAAERGDAAAASTAWREALALSPTHPRLLRRLIRLELETGDAGSGLDYMARLQQTGCAGADWQGQLGADLVLAGHLANGVRILLGTDPEELVPEELFQRAGQIEDTDERRAAALRALAHLLWGRDHAARGDFEAAVRSYRQAWNATRSQGPGAAPLRVELAAAEVRAGRIEAAREDLEGLAWDESVWDAAPAWAREALGQAGLWKKTP